MRRFALALPHSVEGTHMGHPDFRVGGRIFAALPNDGQAVNIKTTPVNLDALVAADPDTFRDAWGGRWLGVRLDRIRLELLQELLADAWRLAAPKRLLKDGR